MSKLKRVLALSGLTGLAAAFAFAVPAQAGIKAVCVVDGEAKAETKISETGPAKYVQLVGGKGTFSFDSVLLTCAGDDGKGLPVVDSITASASGTFRNTVCGTGKVLGVVTRIGGSNAKYQALVGKKFGYEPIAANGAFYWHESDKPATLPKPFEDDDADKPNPFGPKNYVYAGQIQLSPSHGAPKDDPVTELMKTINSPNKCTKAFHVNGVVIVHDK